MSGPSLHMKVEEEISGLAELSRQELVDLWVKARGCNPPKGIKRPLLERSASYRIQARAYGGLKPATRRYLLALADRRPGNQSETPAAQKQCIPQPGARLVRQWHGKTHTVDVVDGGFQWNGAHYRSLSAIAREITGAQWSGPRFFGVRRAVTRKRRT
ncbi:MAG: DUF2924 domain-containing protein [Hyphomicrobiales bacterium]|nr:DUF2924 domain-containing protein [Hyphomicrobiales bacterium]